MRISSKIPTSYLLILIGLFTASSAQAFAQTQAKGSESAQKPAFYQPSTNEEKVAFMRAPGVLEHAKVLAYEIPDPGYINAKYLLDVFEENYRQCVLADPDDLAETFKVLNQVERTAICFYTGSYYQNIAIQISRLKAAAADNNVVIRVLDAALAKLPTSPQKEISHLQDIDVRMAPKLRPGFKFKVPQFLSCSKADRNNGRTLEMVITHLNGKDISTISAIPTEQEVLLPRNTEFVVTKVETSLIDDYEGEVNEQGEMPKITAYKIWLKQLPSKSSSPSPAAGARTF